VKLSQYIQSTAAAPSRCCVFFIYLLLGAAVLGVYLPVIWFDFTNYDDPAYVLKNVPVLNGISWQGIKWAFTQSHSGNWHPLTWLSHMLDCQLYGLKPAGHHVTNLVFHIINTWLVFGLFRYMTGSVWRSAAVAALFGLHPLHVESVAWIAERKDVLSAFFGLLSLWAYALSLGRESRSAPLNFHEYGGEEKQARPHPGPLPQERENRRSLYSRRCRPWGGRVFGRWFVKETLMEREENGPRGGDSKVAGSSASRIFYPLSLVLFACGLMSKPMLVTWPFVLLLLDYWPLGRIQRDNNWRQVLLKLLLEKAPFFALSAAACVITVLSQSSAAALAPLGDVPVAWRILNATVSYFRYLQKLIWPTRLSVIYYDSGPPALTLVLLAVVGLVVVSLLAWRFRRKSPHLVMGWLWYLGTLVPVIGLVKVGSQSMADRYTYLPAIGIFIMLVWAVTNVPRSACRVVAICAFVIFAGFSVVARHQVLFWQNTETLFRHAIAVTKDNFIAYNSLGFYYADLGESDQARSAFKTSLAINPNSAPAWSKLGSVLISEGKYDEAAEKCETALRINPRLPEAHTTLGLALMKQGKTNEALASYAEALRVSPEYAPAHYNLANALAHEGRLDLAREHYEASLRSDPRSADAHNNLAYILARQQRVDDAIVHFGSALRLQPNFWQAHYGLGELLSKQNRLSEATTEFLYVVRIKPELALGHFQLAVVQTRQGKVADAVASAGQARALASKAGQEELARKSQQLLEQLQAR